MGLFWMGVRKIYFSTKFSILLIGLSPICVDDVYAGPMWHFELVLRNIFTCSCISLYIYIYIYGVSVHARYLMNCLLGIFSLVWTPMSTKLWGFSCFLLRNMFGLLVLHFTHLAPHVHFLCLVHALHIITSYTHLC